MNTPAYKIIEAQRNLRVLCDGEYHAIEAKTKLGWHAAAGYPCNCPAAPTFRKADCGHVLPLGSAACESCAERGL